MRSPSGALAANPTERPKGSLDGDARRWGSFHPAWVVVAGCCAVLFAVAMGRGLSGDVYWQLAAGNWMLDHHEVIRHDVFSYTLPGHPWTAEEWGFEVLLAEAVRHLGPICYWLVSAGACSLALIVCVVRWRRQGAGPLWSAVLALPVAGGLLIGEAPRPQDLSYLLFASELLVLTLARSDRRWLAVLPPMILVWANLHGSFLAGVGILALDWALSGLAQAWGALGRDAKLRRTSRLKAGQPLPLVPGAVTLVASAGAAMVNPHGPGLYAYALHVSTSSKLSALIEEWQSPNFHDPVVLVVVALPLIGALAVLGTTRFELGAFDLVLWVVSLVATLHAVRFAPYLNIALGGLLAPAPVLKAERIRPSRLTPLLAGALVAAALAGPHQPPGSPEKGGDLGDPVQAVNWLEGRSGRVLSTYYWNDYLIGRGIPVFVDGRTDLYFGTGVLSTYVKISSLEEAPDPVLARYHIRWVLWPAHEPLSVFLTSDVRWRLVRSFGSQLIFEKWTPGSSG